MAKQKCSKCKKIDIVLCNCCQIKTFVDNGVLMYVASYRSKAAQLNVKNAVLNHFMANDIVDARQEMENSVKMLIPDHP